MLVILSFLYDAFGVLRYDSTALAGLTSAAKVLDALQCSLSYRTGQRAPGKICEPTTKSFHDTSQSSVLFLFKVDNSSVSVFRHIQVDFLLSLVTKWL